jgi:hypothetical protein
MIASIPLWAEIAGAVVVLIACAFLFKRVRETAKAFWNRIVGSVKLLPGKVFQFTLARFWILWVTVLVAGSVWLMFDRSPSLRAAHDIPQGAILDTGDIVLDRGLSLVARAIKQGDPITSRDLVHYAGGIVPRGERLSFAKIASRGEAGVVASRHQGWVCPLKGEGRAVAVSAATCFRGDGACYATIAYPSDLEPLVSAAKARGLFGHSCGTR